MKQVRTGLKELYLVKIKSWIRILTSEFLDNYRNKKPIKQPRIDFNKIRMFSRGWIITIRIGQDRKIEDHCRMRNKIIKSLLNKYQNLMSIVMV